MATPRSIELYHDDSWLFAFQARVVEHATIADKPSVILDRTAFYPESGGQMADRGKLGAASLEIHASGLEREGRAEDGAY